LSRREGEKTVSKPCRSSLKRTPRL
jgi:hypothetical protein